MALLDTSLNVLPEDGHPLIEAPCPAYSNTTVRRAFIARMYLGQANKFKDVCNYYHHLEALEDKLPPQQRAASRHHEITLFSNPPPSSDFFEIHFPKMYSSEPMDPFFTSKVESIKNEKCIFKLEGFNDIGQKGITTAEIISTSHVIRRYCQTIQCTLRRFLECFREHITRCELTESVENVYRYIRRKELEAELKFFGQFPPDFSFLLDDKGDTTVNTTVDTTSSFMDQCSKESTKTDETLQLKLLLGVPPATSSPKKPRRTRKYNKENVNRSNIEDGRYRSPHEFFRSFSNRSTTRIEDIVRMYDSGVGEEKKSKSFEALAPARPTAVQTLSFSTQDFFDASLVKQNELARLSKV